MTIYIKTKDLISYTFNMTENNSFPKKARFTFVNRIQNIVLDIYSTLLKVNEIPICERKSLFIEVLSNTKILLFLIELCLNYKYINFHQCEVWSKHCLNVKYLIAAWLKKSK